tara:strand:+ start:1077 stop:1748 length:672 start_codon:yes stop_codon:yes gene_type:complete
LDRKFSALVFGGTGATGSFVVKNLLKNDNCSLVVVFTRKPALKSLNNKKIKNIVLDSFLDLTETVDLWKDIDVVFNCIGTTRSRAGGAIPFIEIEYGISLEIARMAEKENIEYMSLVSAQGANHNSIAVNFIHPLLYINTMGRKEQTIVKDYKFKCATIFKPGMLIRLQKKTPYFEKISEFFNFGLRVDMLANAMVNEFELNFNQNNKGIFYYTGNEAIKKLT